MKKDTLKEIIVRKKERIAQAKLQLGEEEIKSRMAGLNPARPFRQAISKPRQISLIAEIKKASPSAGLLCADFDYLKIASSYEQAQVQAISVVTEEDYFLGSLNTLSEVRNLVSVPVLRKDFILEPYQVYESRLYGADAILLISEALNQEVIQELSSLASSLGMCSLVEVHSERELKKVLKLKNISLIGLNNRDLHTLEVDPKTVERLYPLVPKDKTVVVESGIRSFKDVLFYKILGINAVLVGTVLMEAADTRKKIEELMGW
jgi:indole-3-glycerol phosphate synthase